MQAPRFWFAPPERPGLAARVLAPLGTLYAAATARRVRRAGLRTGCKVVCVGNINVGGTGKTPTVIALALALQARGVKAQVVSTGYGGRLAGPVAVDERRHSAADVGDEPLLLAAFLPVWVARDRRAGCRAAEAAGADVILLDDGFQDPAVEKDLSIVVVDAQRGFGNGRCLPAGPLREPVAAGMRRADAVLAIGPGEAAAELMRRWDAVLPALRIAGRLAPLETGMDWAGLRVLAFAGIGHPEKFIATLAGLGAEIAEVQALDDHQPLTPALFARLEARAAALGAQLVTTEKDAVRLAPELRGRVLTLPVRLEITTPETWAALLDRAMPGGAR